MKRGMPLRFRWHQWWDFLTNFPHFSTGEALFLMVNAIALIILSVAVMTISYYLLTAHLLSRHTHRTLWDVLRLARGNRGIGALIFLAAIAFVIVDFLVVLVTTVLLR